VRLFCEGAPGGEGGPLLRGGAVRPQPVYLLGGSQELTPAAAVGAWVGAAAATAAAAADAVGVCLVLSSPGSSSWGPSAAAAMLQLAATAASGMMLQKPGGSGDEGSGDGRQEATPPLLRWRTIWVPLCHPAAAGCTIIGGPSALLMDDEWAAIESAACVVLDFSAAAAFSDDAGSQPAAAIAGQEEEGGEQSSHCLAQPSMVVKGDDEEHGARSGEGGGLAAREARVRAAQTVYAVAGMQQAVWLRWLQGAKIVAIGDAAALIGGLADGAERRIAHHAS